MCTEDMVSLADNANHRDRRPEESVLQHACIERMEEIRLARPEADAAKGPRHSPLLLFTHDGHLFIARRPHVCQHERQKSHKYQRLVGDDDEFIIRVCAIEAVAEEGDDRKDQWHP